MQAYLLEKNVYDFVCAKNFKSVPKYICCKKFVKRKERNLSKIINLIVILIKRVVSFHEFLLSVHQENILILKTKSTGENLQL